MNNFTDIGYKNIYLNPGDKMIPQFLSSLRPGKAALKHSYPNLQYSKYIIVIYKEWDKFSPSFKRWGVKEYPHKEYQKYLDIARSIDPEKHLLIEHSWACENYNIFVNKISEKFKITKNNTTRAPTNRLNKGGALCRETENIFRPLSAKIK